MRALAVSLVLVYHLWPTRVPGGFVGVDVFFVISGFLITSHLLRHPPTKLRDLAEFWGRRVRRLLPVAFLVILVTLAGTLLVGPMTQWRNEGVSAVASGMYVQNWWLAVQSVDYLNTTNSASLFQHFWSLSVEEQFYLGWPMLIGIAAYVARRRGRRQSWAIGIGITIVVVASFVFSVAYTALNPARAYFVTPTRMWELGAGGLIAVVYPRLQHMLVVWHPATRVATIALGVSLTLVSAYWIPEQGFPGGIAAAPVAGAALVLAFGPADYAVSFDRILRVRPVQRLGDISYSVYLWHWPVIMLVPWAMGRPLTWPVKVVLIVVILGLSWASKVHIEDRYRGSRPLGIPLRRTFIFLVVGMMTVSLAGASVYLLGTRTSVSSAPVMPDNATCFGASARLDPACQADPALVPSALLMTPFQAAGDRNRAYADGCWWWMTDPTHYPACEYGSRDPAATQIALFGNSHAGPYLDPLVTIATERGWGLRTYLASRCYPSILPENFQAAAAMDGCLEFTAHAIADMKARGVKLVVMTARTGNMELVGVSSDSQYEAKRDMYQSLIQTLVASQIRVVVVRDVPFPELSVPDCLSRLLGHGDPSVCAGPRAGRLSPDPLYDAAAAQGPGVWPVDFSNAMCDANLCQDVVGGVIVYFDREHLTTTFANTLGPYLEPVLLRALSG